MSVRHVLAALAAEIGTGQSQRTLCPVCHGGSSKEETFVITKQDTGVILWICHRASCGIRGGFNTGRVPPPVQTDELKTRAVWRGEVETLDSNQLGNIAKDWGLDAPSQWFWTDDYGGRIAMSVRSPDDTHRGWVLRAAHGQQPKALTYLDEGVPQCSWYIRHLSSPLVVVEDIPSALRLSAHVNAVSLLGTNVSAPVSLEIQRHKTGVVYLALDQDATQKAFDLKQRYRLLWGCVEVLPLKKDFKNMDEEELCFKLHQTWAKERQT